MIKLSHREIFPNNHYFIAETVLKTNAKTFEHTHDFYEIFIVTEGSVAHLIGEMEESLIKRQMILVHPEDKHCFRRLNTANASFVNIAFTKELYAWMQKIYSQYDERNERMEENTDFGEKNMRTTVIIPEKIYESILLRIAYIIEQRISRSEIRGKDLLSGLLMDMFTLFYNRNASEEHAPQWLSYACERMKEPENFIEGIHRFVKLSGKSQEHLTRSLQKFLQITPSTYVNHLRLNYAAELLKITDLPVLEILLKSGFNNVSFFNQLFKSTFQMTPSHYRSITLV